MSPKPNLRTVPPTARSARAPERRKLTPPSRPPVIAEFQSDAAELEERNPPRVARATLYLVSLLIACAVLWACLSSVDEVVTAPGKLITTQQTIIVQPLETAIIRSIDVSAGDVVKAGQTLATLDPTFTRSDMDQVTSKLSALNAQVKRLEAEMGGVPYLVSADANADEHLQEEIYTQRRVYYAAQLQNYDQQIAMQKAALDASQAERATLDERLDTIRQIEGIRDTLFQHQTGSLFNLLTTRDSRLDVEGSIARVAGSAMQAGHALQKAEADRQVFIEDFRRTAMDQLVDLRSQRDAAADTLEKMQLRHQMAVMTAPADAVVLDLAPRSIGSVVREAEPLFTLVPLNVPLEAEVSINARDIGRIDIKQRARIKFDAFPFQKYGTATSTVRTVSHDTFVADPSKTGNAPGPAAFFKARIPMTDVKLRAFPETPRLIPGMTVTAEIDVGRRSVISYFLDPLLRTFDESIREP